MNGICVLKRRSGQVMARAASRNRKHRELGAVMQSHRVGDSPIQCLIYLSNERRCENMYNMVPQSKESKHCNLDNPPK